MEAGTEETTIFQWDLYVVPPSRAQNDASTRQHGPQARLETTKSCAEYSNVAWLGKQPTRLDALAVTLAHVNMRR